jgi:hypothetical protein
MQALITAIENKLLDSAVYNDVGGRCYYDTADSDDLPRLVYSIVSAVPDKTFSELYHDVLIQFDLFSALSAGKTQITTMYADLISLMDECSLSITGYTLVWCREQNLVTMVEDLSALQDGSSIALHWAVDFEARISKN